MIPVRNGASTLRDCLAAVLRLEYPPDRREVVVVDNGSADGTAAIARALPVRYLREPRRGAVHARNRGIAETAGAIVAFTDADCVPTRRWLAELVAPFADAAVAATAGELVAFPPTTGAERYMARRKPRWQRWASSGRVPWFLIGNCAIRRDVFARIGGLDPAFARVGCEDIDFSRRFFDAGLELRYCSRAVAFHRHRATGRSLFTQQLRNGRGQSLVQHKHRPVRWGWREELHAWRDLAADAWRLAAARTAKNGSPDERSDAYYDLVRKLAQRIGFVDGMLRWTLLGAGRARDASRGGTDG